MTDKAKPTKHTTKISMKHHKSKMNKAVEAEVCMSKRKEQQQKKARERDFFMKCEK